VAAAKANGSGAAKPSLPPINASISVGRNGADAGMVKTRGSIFGFAEKRCDGLADSEAR
jgi:hypothetical protein